MICITNITAHWQPEELAHEVVFEAGANNLAFVVEILRADEAHHAVYQERIEAPSNAIGARFQCQLVHSVVSLCGERAALTGFEIHDVFTLPGHIAAAVMLENLLAAVTNHFQRNSETAIRGLRSGNRLEEKIHGRAALQSRQLRADVRKAADLRGHFIDIDEAVQRLKDRSRSFDGI